MSGVDTGDRETKIDPWFQAAENVGDPDEPRVREAVIGRLFGAAPESGTPIKVDRYVLAQRVGTGGLGAVYEAWDPALGRKVAVKLLRSHGSAVAHNRLLREARAIARISHPNVVAVHDVGTYDAETIGGEPGEVGVFVVMELVDGQDMMAWSGTARTWQEIVGAFARAGRGLVAAHAAGLVHRDFKPANVMIARDGRVFVLDFGLAQPAVDHSEGSSGAPVERPRPAGEDQTSQGTPGRGITVGDKLTEVGHVIGTPRYMSP